MDVKDKIANLSDKEKIVMLKKIEIVEKMREFATLYHRNARGDKLNFDEFIHMVDFYDYGAFNSKNVLVAGTQLGKSLAAVIYALACSYCGLQVMYIFPHKKFKDSYIQEKILKPISESPEYKEVLRGAVAHNVDILNFGAGFIKFISANVAADVTSFSGDVLIIEEIDTFDNKAKDNMPKAFGRLDDSPYQFSLIISNPETGTIIDWYERSDQRVRKFPCSECGDFYEIDWFKSVVEEILDEETGDLITVKARDKEWYRGCGRDMYVKCPCPTCSGNLIRDSEDSFWDITAESEEGIAGYHMPSTISLRRDISAMFEEYVRAIDNPTELAAFYFRFLALTFNSMGHNISSTVLSNCAKDEEFQFELQGFEAYWVNDLDKINQNKKKHEKLYSVMGVDVRGESIDVNIAMVENGYERLIYVAKIDPMTQMDYFYDLFDRYNIKYGIIDGYPETVLARQIQEKVACDFWRCKFKGVGDAREDKVDHNEMMLVTDRTTMLDLSYQKYKRKKMLLPTNFEEILNGQWIKEMQALSRKLTEDNKGKARVSWESKKGNKVDDHSRLADGYRHKAYLISIEEEELTVNDIYFQRDDDYDE